MKCQTCNVDKTYSLMLPSGTSSCWRCVALIFDAALSSGWTVVGGKAMKPCPGFNHGPLPDGTTCICNGTGMVEAEK